MLMVNLPISIYNNHIGIAIKSHTIFFNFFQQDPTYFKYLVFLINRYFYDHYPSIGLRGLQYFKVVKRVNSIYLKQNHTYLLILKGVILKYKRKY